MKSQKNTKEMYLEKLIKQLRKAPCLYGWQRENVARNIKICEMQIKIRDKCHRS